jgi:hypothetical protein
LSSITHLSAQHRSFDLDDNISNEQQIQTRKTSSRISTSSLMSFSEANKKMNQNTFVNSLNTPQNINNSFPTTFLTTAWYKRFYADDVVFNMCLYWHYVCNLLWKGLVVRHEKRKKDINYLKSVKSEINNIDNINNRERIKIFSKNKVQYDNDSGEECLGEGSSSGILLLPFNNGIMNGELMLLLHLIYSKFAQIKILFEKGLKLVQQEKVSNLSKEGNGLIKNGSKNKSFKKNNSSGLISEKISTKNVLSKVGVVNLSQFLLEKEKKKFFLFFFFFIFDKNIIL